MRLKQRLKAVIFDFDGVILESVPVKTEAFRQLFSFVPEHLEQIIEYHLDNGGISRFVKIRYIFEHILKQDLTEERFDDLVQEYSRLVLGGVLRAPFVPGAPACLERLYSQIPLFIASGTPDQELHFILASRNLETYFTAVYGASMQKTEALRDIGRRYSILSSEMLFVGDAPSDRDAAVAAGVRFVGRIRPDDRDRLTGTRGVEFIIRNLRDLCVFVEREVA